MPTKEQGYALHCGHDVWSPDTTKVEDGKYPCPVCGRLVEISYFLTRTKNDELCPICNKPLFGTDQTLTSMEDERTVHLSCYLSEPCDCPHEDHGCHYEGYCEHRKAPDKDLNGTYLPTCGLKFPDGDNK
jgi:hypothetical protein